MEKKDHISYWIDSAKAPDFPEYSGNQECDVAVVGAGLTGITTALLLAEQGLNVIILEADKTGTGTSGYTTAKITIQHGLKYKDLSDDRAMAYANANMAGQKLMEENISRYEIECDFTRLPAYVYTRTDTEIGNIEKEMRAYERLRLNGEIVTKTKLPFAVKSAIVLYDQAQFHPLKYLYALVRRLADMGVKIYERSKVINVERGDETCEVQTDQGKLTAKTVVLATSYPLVDLPGMFFIKLHQERSYIISTPAKSVDVEGMYINAEEPANSIRMHYTDKGTLLLLGGYGHRTGKENEETGYDSLEDFLRNDFPNADKHANYRWSAQDCAPLDGMPYVGPITREPPNVYVAAGFNKWGMTNSAAAAIMIADSITGEVRIDKEVRYMFCPRRFTPGASAKDFFIHAGNVISSFTAGNINIPAGEYDDVPPGKGAVLRVNGKAQAIYKDEEGSIHAFHAHCMHMHCPLEYNELENTFDCTCHGSRYSMRGEVLRGPAKLPLVRVEENED